MIENVQKLNKSSSGFLIAGSRGMASSAAASRIRRIVVAHRLDVFYRAVLQLMMVSNIFVYIFFSHIPLTAETSGFVFLQPSSLHSWLKHIEYNIL